MGERGVGAGRRRVARERLHLDGERTLPWLKKKGVAAVIAFLQFLPVTKGPLAGELMKLLPEQREFVEEVYGNSDENGRRVRRIGIKSEPKGNGKTGLVAGLCLCHLLGPEAEPRGEVYSAAIDRQQAAIIFAEMEAIIVAIPEFACRVNIQRFHKKIEVLTGDGAGSIYEALSSDARRAHGLAPSLFAYDELAQAKDRVLLDNLINGLGKRDEALGLIISTQAPDDTHPLSELIDDGLTGADPSIYVQLLAAPQDADPFDEATWLACNPALGKYLSLKEMREAAWRAQRIPAFEPAFRNLRLNQRVDSAVENRLLPRPKWEACALPVDREQLKGRKCYGGLDLSGKLDLSALVLAFPDDDPDPVYDLLALFWTPQEALDTRAQRERELFKTWIDRKFITPVPGPVIKYRYMAQQLRELQREFDIQAIGYDRWRIEDFKSDMEDEGVDLPLEEFGQGYQSMAPAVETLIERALSGKIRHGGNPVLTACVVNAITIPNEAGELKIHKGKSNRAGMVRVDGAVAAAMALQTAKRFVGEPKGITSQMILERGGLW